MKILFFANTEWYLYNFRLPLALYLRDQGHEVVMLSPPGPYAAQLQAAGFRALTVPMQRRSLNPLRELALFQHIRQIYAQEHPDLAHHFTIKCVVYGALAARLTGVPKRINAVTGLGHVFTSDRLKARLLRLPALACLETLVHLGTGSLPMNRYLVAIDIPDAVWAARAVETPASLPVGWDAVPTGKVSLDFGDAWLSTRRGAVLALPSAIVPEDQVILINPQHPDAIALTAAKLRKWRYDPRLF